MGSYVAPHAGFSLSSYITPLPCHDWGVRMFSAVTEYQYVQIRLINLAQD